MFHSSMLFLCTLKSATAYIPLSPQYSLIPAGKTIFLILDIISTAVNVLVCIELSLDSIGSNGQKEVSTIKIEEGGPEIWKIHPNDPRSGFFLLNLSKKVKCHLFCITPTIHFYHKTLGYSTFLGSL